MKTNSTIILTLFLVAYFNLQGQDQTMSYQDLQNYLPTSISGYVAGEPGGQSMNTQGMSFSSADIEFTNSEGDYIRITLMDYIGAVGMYQAATAMWAAGMSFENDESIANSIQWDDNIVGWEEFRKKENEANLALGIGERFFLSIEANNQNNTDFIKSVAKTMELNSLANL